MYNIFELQEKSLDDLKMIATELGIDDENRDRTQLIYDIIDHQVDHPDIKKSEKPKKTKKTPKTEKSDKAKQITGKKAPAEVEAKESKEPVASAIEPKEADKKMEPQTKRGKRPRISKEAEANVSEWQRQNAPQLMDTQAAKVEHTDESTNMNEEVPADKKTTHDKKENLKQKRKRTHESTEAVAPQQPVKAVEEETNEAPATFETTTAPKPERQERNEQRPRRDDLLNQFDSRPKAYSRSCLKALDSCAHRTTTTCPHLTTSTSRSRKLS